jgi:hypothetical protein
LTRTTSNGNVRGVPSEKGVELYSTPIQCVLMSGRLNTF